MRGSPPLSSGSNAIADILDHEIIETEETLQNQSLQSRPNAKEYLDGDRVNGSSKEDKFTLEPTSWSKGHPDEDGQKPILMREDLAKKNGLKVGDRCVSSPSLYADNEKGANETGQ